MAIVYSVMPSFDLSSELHAAVVYGDESAVEAILKTGIDIEATNRDGLTALLIAVYKKHKPIIKLLLEYGADIGASCSESGRHDQFGIKTTVLHYAVEWVVDESITKLLLTVKPNFEPASSEIFFRIVNYALQRKNLKILKYLFRDTDPSKLTSSIKNLISFEEIPAIDIRNHYDFSALVLAIKEKKFQTLKWLLENGASLYRVPLYCHSDQRHYQSCSMLHMAAFWYDENQDEEMVRLLIDYSECLEAITVCNTTPLHIAARYDKFELVKLLVSLGADVNKKSLDYFKPLFDTLHHPTLRTFKYFLATKKIIPESLPLVAVYITRNRLEGRYSHALNILLQSCWTDQYRRRVNDCMALHLAIILRNQAAIDFILDHDPTAINRIWEGVYPIHRAADATNIDCIMRLLDLGADINIKDLLYGFSALNYAFRQMHTSTVSFLLSKGADISTLYNCECRKWLENFISLRRSDMIELVLDAFPDLFHFYTHHPDRYFADIITRQIIKLKTAKIPLDPYYLHWQEFCYENETEEFSNYCMKEINQLQKEMICETSFLSYHNFLTNNVRRLANYTRNTDITANFKPHLLLHKFPIYGLMIITSYHRALNHLKLILNFETVLADILCHFPTNFVRNIPDYLSGTDLSMLLGNHVPRFMPINILLRSLEPISSIVYN